MAIDPQHPFLAAANITYVLTSGGHNGGIVAPPGEEGHSYQVLTKQTDGPYVGPDEWIRLAPHHQGTWWTEWVRFHEDHSGEPVAPPAIGCSQDSASLKDAPGHFVLQR